MYIVHMNLCKCLIFYSNFGKFFLLCISPFHTFLWFCHAYNCCTKKKKMKSINMHKSIIIHKMEKFH